MTHLPGFVFPAVTHWTPKPANRERKENFNTDFLWFLTHHRPSEGSSTNGARPFLSNSQTREVCLQSPSILNLSPHLTVTSHTAARCVALSPRHCHCHCHHHARQAPTLLLTSPLTKRGPRGFRCRLGHGCGAEWWIKSMLSRSRRPPWLWPVQPPLCNCTSCPRSPLS